MSETNTTRLLELVQRELGAREARIEFGGEPPSDPCSLWAPLPGGWRLVAKFNAAPDSAKQQSLKLRQLAGSFFDLPPQAPQPNAEGHANWTTRRLDDELCALAARTGAMSAVVIDYQSPVLWGTSEPRVGDESINVAQRLAQLATMAERGGLDLLKLCKLSPEQAEHVLSESDLNEGSRATLRRELGRLRGLDPVRRQTDIVTSRAIAELRDAIGQEHPPTGHFRQVVHRDELGYLARSFATIYVLLLVFKNTYSELHAEAALLHALPVIERLVLALPPVEPPPKGGRVVKLPVPRSEG